MTFSNDEAKLRTSSVPQRDSQSRHWSNNSLEEWKTCIHEVIHDQVLKHPQREAISSEEVSLSYHELDRLASILANHLVTLGAGPEVIVPICFEKGPSYVISMLGVLKANAAFVPLDPEVPIARLKKLIGNVDAKLLLCSQKYANVFTPIVENALSIDLEMIENISRISQTKNQRNVPATSKNLAYLIYTSGSTGEPKGTTIEHGAFCSGARAHGPAMLMKPDSRVLQFAAHTFDASLVEIITTLMVGGTICIPSENTRLNDIVGFINKHQVNWAVLTPSFIGFINPSQVPGLKTLVLAGEAMSQTHLTTWSKDRHLVNAYGPSEASVCCSANSCITPETQPTNIGGAVGCHLFVVDPEDHNILLDVGSCGELLIAGPTIARGYHGDAVKTAAAFIRPPGWAAEISGGSWRMYKTGDLVRQDADGTFHFVGRKDNQVKVHGQRVETGEIEAHFSAITKVKHGLVILPKKGPFTGRLVSILSIYPTSTKPHGNKDLQILDDTVDEIKDVQDVLSSRLPAYMVPSVTITVENIPLLPSGKLDRKSVTQWVENMNDGLYRQIIGTTQTQHAPTNAGQTSATELESLIRLVFSHVLNLSPDSVDLHRSFISMGGDSISAMQVKSQCLKKDINISVQEILRTKSIIHLAQCAKPVDKPSHHEEIVEQNFNLSPIQDMFFKLPNQGKDHFNQSFFLRITRRVGKRELRQAIETIINRHSMLRARFTKSSTGIWSQRITENIDASYRLKYYDVKTRDAATPAIANSQASLDIVHGPLFAADLFDVDGSEQLLFMVGHHLVIDLVSWRVILEDLEEALSEKQNMGAMISNIGKPLSFQTWNQLQHDHAQSQSVESVLPIDSVPAGDATYWGMETQANTYGSVTSLGFEVDHATTAIMLTKCHEALQTETIDILLSALIHSFSDVFTDRPLPAIFNEGHGREPSEMAVDLSRTVGWFTIMYPVHVPDSAAKDAIDTVRHVKDLRRKITGNGRPYFASRCLTEAGRERFSHHWPLEITFNYLGQYQQLERAGALLNPVDEMAGEARGAGGTADVGQETPRFGLFEISAVIAQGKLRFSFTFSRHMKHQDKIAQWIATCQQTIGNMARMLAATAPRLTIGDFPLISIDYEGLRTLVNEKLPSIGVNEAEVEDIYPCSSMQEGLLISQTKDTGFYAVQVICEVKLQGGIVADRERLAIAWQSVVRRHASLRTLFIESVSSDEGLYDQVVLRKVDPNIAQMNCSSERYGLRILSAKQPMKTGGGLPPHKFTICETSDKKLLFKLEISHTIMDGVSMSIILRDLGLAYEGHLSEGPGPLYSDYISFLQKLPSDQSIEYWKSYLKDLEPCTFPILNDGIVVEKKLQSLRLDFSDSKYLKLKHFCEKNGVTFSNALHTAWGLILRSYTGSDDLSFGYLTSGRDAAGVQGIEDAVGPFINMLVCRMSITNSSRLGAILDQVQKDYMDSLPHRYTSLAEVQHALRLSGAPLFNTALSYQKLTPELTTQTSNVTFEERVPIYDPTEYSLSINIVASDEKAIIDLDYWTDHISEGQVANIACAFLQALENVTHHSHDPINQLDHLGDTSLGEILDWNGNMPEAIEDCVHHVIQKHSHASPKAPAICAWDAELSYQELDKLSTRLAQHLVNLGVGPETFVPTCFEKSAYTIVAMIAVLKAGGAAVPLDAKFPESALQLRVRDTQAKVVLTAPSRAHMFENMVPNVVEVSKEFLESLPAARGIPCSTVRPNNPCFIIYTSGSTGVPKGVVLEHRSIVTSGRATGDAYGFGPHSRVLQFAAYTFDNSLAEIFITLMRGGVVCVPSEHDRFNNLAGAINELNVNFMDITPTVASFLHPTEVPKVRGVSLGGEPLTKENIEVWGKAVDLHCCYGPSECSINSVWNNNLLGSSEATNIGRSIGSVSWICWPTNHNQLTPIGGVGELLIEGPILARKYLHDDEKTAKSFILNPKWAATGGKRRFYKTGDLCRYNSNGTLTYLGRLDSQVKLNGQRIELGEIEHHLQINLPSEAQSAIELINISHGQKTSKALAAFLCLNPNNSTTMADEDSYLLPMTEHVRSIAASLETAIASALPAYMMPTVFVPLKAMPMTSSGKLDRRRLRALCDKFSEEQGAMYRLAHNTGRAPSTEMEKVLANLWEIVLDLAPNSVCADDNFFRVGGDSIGCMKLITAARAKGISINVATVFSKAKLSDLSMAATLVSERDLANDDLKDIQPFSLLKGVNSISELKKEVASQCRINVNSIQDIYPATSIQEGLVALSNKNPGAYVAQNVYRLPADIDIQKFRQAWNRVVEAEVILRTRIVFTEAKGFLQVVTRDPIVWNTAQTFEDIADIDRLLPAYNGAALSRYTIIEDSESPQFVWTCHHGLYDGWSLPTLLEKVEACYHKNKLEATASYPRFIKYLSEISETESDDFWRAKLLETSSMPFPPLPHPSYQVRATSLSTHVAYISRKAGSQITLPSIIRAAWALVLGTYSGSNDDIVFGETLTGRDAPVQGIADMIGPTLATVPTRIQVDRTVSITKFLENVQTQSAEAIPYQFAGLQHIKHISEDTRMACNFQNLLAIHHEVKDDSVGLWDLRSSGTIGTNFYSYPLTMSCQIEDGKVEIEAHFDDHVISKFQVERVLHQLEYIMESLNSPQNSDQKLSDLSMLNPNDQKTISTWNQEPLTTINKSIHQLIERQVCEQHESAIAVDAFDMKLTYRELDDLSTRLALHLNSLKLKSTLIPIFFEKSAWPIVAMLAVLKTGAAFVPLDPAAPNARLLGIIEDTNAVMVLCSRKHAKLCSTFAPALLVVDHKTLEGLPKCRPFPKSWDQLPQCNPETAAYVIFTSGTTGKPKGTIIQHRAFCSGAAAHAPALRMTSTSRVLQFASFTFDASLLEILTTLTLGATVCVPSDEDRMNNIAKVINDMRITWTLLTPSFIQLIRPSDIPSLRTLVLGGEAMSQSHISIWADKLQLVNAYGPTECAVVATVNTNMTPTADPTNMGHAVGSRAYIVDPENHNKLVPVGAVGELVFEGPILAQSYLNNESKTLEVFVENPTWALSKTASNGVKSRRMYMTGDLVKYAPIGDGSLIFLGRKDTQVKIRGQRLELGEVETHLRTDPAIRHALVTIPKTGLCKKRLVAVLSLQELPSSTGFAVISQEVCEFYVSEIRERLCDQLPPYMIPSHFIVIQGLPLLPSGKLDRRQIDKWLEDMTPEVFHQISDVVEENNGLSATTIEHQLQLIWAKALNLPASKIGLHQSFLHLGGDSISAMQVMSTCRSQDLGVTVQDIIQSKSISQLAKCVTLPEQTNYEDEAFDLPFDLSPIQKLYFQCVGDKWSHFNQSVLLKISKTIKLETVASAIETIAKTHSMLRARFAPNEAGIWQQRILPHATTTYRFDTQATTMSDYPTIIEESQKNLDIENGPVFAVDLMDIEGTKQRYLSLVAHHLAIDVVSWRIILQDLEDILESGNLKMDSSLPFQTWSRLQLEHSQEIVSSNGYKLTDVPFGDFAYWDMAGKQNSYGDTIDESFEIDAETSALLLGRSHAALNTDPVDIFVAAVMTAFRKVFSDRATSPTIWNEGHGREPWLNSKIDLSRTVGWFTTMCPLYLPSTAGGQTTELLNTIRWVKDLRSRIPDKGRPYFAHRQLTEQGQEQYSGHWPMEVTFNYLGKLQQLERPDAILQQVDGATNSDFDIGTDVPRFALFEISAQVVHGAIKFSFSYNKKMKRQAKIRRWVMESQTALRNAAEQLAHIKPERTLSDFPLLPLSYTGMAKFMEKLPQLGLSSLDEVEDIYPVSPMQNGMLLAQLKNPNLYAYGATFEAQATNGTTLNAKLLVAAWQDVVHRHSSLRTIFIESLGEFGVMDQVVVKDRPARISWIPSSNITNDPNKIFAEQQDINFHDPQPPHRFSICQTKDGRVYCKLDISHTISDGTSIPILLHDLSHAYEIQLATHGNMAIDQHASVGRQIVEARRNNANSQSYLPSAPLFSEYISYIQLQSATDNLNYWKAYLAEVEPCTFPSLTDGLKPARELRSHVLKLSESTKLKSFATQAGFTLSNVLQLAWALVLKIYTGNTDVSFGTLTSGRDVPIQGISAAVGAFINMLTFRMDLKETLSVNQALQQIQTDFGKGMTHQACSLADIQHELQLSGTSLFNTAFTFQRRTSGKEATPSALKFDFLTAEDPSEYDLTINVEALDSGVEIHFGYWTNILSEAQMANLSQTFDHVVNSIIHSQAGSSSQKIGDLDFFSAYSRKQVKKWNATMPAKVNRCVHDIIDGQKGSAPAIDAWDGKLTYSEFEKVTNRLAARLVQLGVKPEMYVPLCFEKSIYTVISMVAVMKAGGAFVPLDPSHPHGRLQHFVDDVEANLVLCSKMHQEKIEAVAKHALIIDQNLIDSLSDLPLKPAAKHNNPAYIIFTSGTTGLPKGTIVEHAAFCTSAIEHAKAMHMGPRSRVFQFASHTFDASVMEILSTLVVGGCVCIPSDMDRMNDIPGAIKRLGVTWTLLTPSVANTLTPKGVPSLKVLVTGGEAMSAGHITKWKGKTCLINAYGPSETSVIASTSTKVDLNGNEISSDTSNIGSAVGGRNWIIDPKNYNKLIPVGGIGELVVEGHILARGYLKNPEKTAQAFISQPTWLKDMGGHERMYRTGDLVRYCTDGTLSFVARKDTQIKLNGQRIELSEIEYQVNAHMQYAQSAVELVAPMSRVATKALAVFFCPPQTSSTNHSLEDIITNDDILLPMTKDIAAIAKNLDSALGHVLPKYMIPSFYIPITKMPWTSSGKLDRTKLRNIVATLPKESTAPYRLLNTETKTNNAANVGTDMEKKLQKLWETAMSVDNVGAEDSFFRLGGDSVTAMKLVSAARAEGISLTVIDIFRNPKLADMALVCGVLEEDNHAELKEFALLKTDHIDPILDEIVEQSKLNKQAIQNVYPTSQLQDGLLTLSLQQAGAYVAHNIFRIPADIDMDRLKSVWQNTLNEVDILRTRIVHMESGKFLQVVTKPTPIVWHTAGNLEDFKAEDISLPAHNGSELTRFTIVIDGTTNQRFFIWSIHHALYDGWSLPMVLARVQSGYLDSSSSFPTTPYVSFIKYVTDVDQQVSDDFWRTRLAGASPLQFPQNMQADDTRPRQNRVLNHNIEICEKATRMEVTIPSMIRAAWSLIVAAYSGSNDVVFGETLAGRDIPVTGIADIIGPIFTTVPTRVQVDRNLTISHFLKSIHEKATEIIPYQHAGLQRIKRLDSDTDLACDFQNLLVIQTAEEETEDEFWQMENEGVADNFFTYPLVLECKASADSTKCGIVAHFDANVIPSWQVQRLLCQLDGVLRQLSFAQRSGGEEKVGDVQILSPEDIQLLNDFNSEAPLVVESTIHEEFKKVTSKQPEAMAISSWDGEFTYQEVYNHALRLAHHLVSLGVGPEVFVPICMDKSAWATISMIAIMMAGGAYSPLDPAAPIARHQEMMGDLNANIMLCTPKYSQRYVGLIDRIVSLDKDFVTDLPRKTNFNDLSRVTSKNPAYVIFTSGSTGKPKGCVIEHRAITTSCVAMREAMLMKSDSRVFQFASYTFDVSVLEIFTTLTYGGVCCIPSEEARVGDVGGAIAALNVQWAFLTPSVANIFEPASVPSLKTLVCGGEAMSLENVVKWAPHVRLVNGYGPTEASVIALSNDAVSDERNPAKIGRALRGNHAWIGDLNDPNQLAPVGCPGELLLEGPILAREYINAPDKTAEAFIINPAWISLFPDTDSSIAPRRVYKTGDLVQYDENLDVIFIGRKDSQVKINGQRMELGEIENALDVDPEIKHALVAFPKTGHFKKRLVAVISLAMLSRESIESNVCQIVEDGPRGTLARAEIAKAKTRLSNKLPAFMIPATWIALEAIPLLPSGKLDRRGVTSWLEKIEEKAYEKIMEADEEEDNSTPATETSLLLQGIVSRVLNIPIQKTKLSSSFLTLGGDSISAMQVMAMCRKEKMNFTLSEVLRSKSIHQLAASAKFAGDRVFQAEKVEEQFELSPIQQLYFQAKAADEQKPNSRFNQSFSLRITRKVDSERVKAAIDAIVNKHSMLRAKFAKSTNGVWQQRITKNTATSYRFKVHDVEAAVDVPPIVGNSQATLDIQQGPIFSVDLFNISGEDQMLFLCSHHLCIDMVSWRIIMSDFEEHLLNKGDQISDPPLSYQVWLKMQAEHANTTAKNRLSVLPTMNIGPSQLDYWGMSEQINTYGDVETSAFTVNQSLTALAMGKSNLSLRTEPVEIFLSAIAHSFSRTFVDRDVAPIFTESHGRESWDSSIDISRTVGWFTSIFPLQVNVDSEDDDVVDTVRRMKDLKRKVPDNGRPYFAHRFLTPEGKKQFKNHDGTMEIIFNYLGRMQQLEADDSLLQQWTYPENDENERLVADVGSQAERFALFEITCSVVADKIQFSFIYNKKTTHQEDIQRWITECQRTLEETIERLAGIKDETVFTLSDFPLLPISYDGLKKIVTRSLPQVGITPDMVENIYPCAPLQEGLILSQIKDPSLYHFHAVFEVNLAKDGLPINSERLMRAWQQVVDYHGALRTVFADSVYKGDIFNQIIIKQIDSGALSIRCDDSEALEKLSKISILDHNYKKQPRLPHQITICQCSSGKVYFKAEINHGVIDGGSANIMLRDLSLAYHGELPDAPGPLYSDYIGYIKSVQHGSGNTYWKDYLHGARPCHFPSLTDGAEKLLHSAPMEFDRFPELQAMCKRMKVTLANVMQAAWALCLRAYINSDDINFGYLTSGRDVPVAGVSDTVGAFINMLVCRVKFSPQSTLKEVYQKVQQDYIESLEFQHTSLAQVQHDITGGQPLFNTAVSIQKGASSDEAEESGTISFDPVVAHDPGEYAITLNVRTFLNDEGAVLRYWTSFVSDEQATVLAKKMSRVLEHFINKPHQTVEELDLSDESIKPKIETEEQQPEPELQPQSPTTLDSTEQLRSMISETVREVISEMFKSGTLVSYGNQDVRDTIDFVNRQIIPQSQSVQIAQPMIDYSQLTPAPRGVELKPKRTIASELMNPMDNGHVEKRLLAIWSDLLMISEESIRGEDNFFSLGGDSIIAMQMVGIARDEDLALTVATIFRHPIFADMAAVIKLADEANAPLDVTGQTENPEAREIRAQTIQNALYQRYSLLEAANVDAFLQDNICPKVTTFRGGITDVFPVTDFQALAITGTLMEKKWMLNYFHLTGEGPLDLKRLKIAVHRLVDAFDILRTVFVPYGNRFFQVVLRKLLPSFSVHECDDLDQFTTELQQRDREHGPRLGESYLQFTVAKQRDSLRHRIIIRMSHAQYDGVCMPAILYGLQKGYRSLAIAPTPSFSGYVRDAARRTTDDHYTYWKGLLDGSSMTEVVRRRGPDYTRGGEVISLKRIVRFASLATKVITPASIIKAAWSLVLAQVGATDDIIFGNVISGRNASVMGVESIVGPCVNMVPVRVAFQSDWTVLDLLHHIQNQQVSNMPYESLGFREIIKHCTSWPDWTNFSTVCQHQNIQRSAELEIGRNKYTLGALGSQEDFADITILSTPQEDESIEISLIFTENSGITATFAQALFEDLCATSTAFSENPSTLLPSPKDLSSLTRQTVDDPTPEVDASLSANLRGINREELLIYNDLLTRAWRQILWDKKGSVAVIDFDSSFYDLGGDIVGVAQMASLLESEGFKLRVEDLVDHPLLVEQLALCAVFMQKKRADDAAEQAEWAPQEAEEQTAVPKKGLKKILGKTGGLKKMFKKKEKKDGEEEHAT